MREFAIMILSDITRTMSLIMTIILQGVGYEAFVTGKTG